MKAGTRMALGVAAGYLLGRTKKMRLALMIAAAGATGKAGVSPSKLVRNGLSQLASSEEIGKLTSLAKDELLTAAKSAAVTAASGRIESLTERLQDGGNPAGEARNPAGEEKATEPAGDEPDQETGEEAAEKPRRRRTPTRRSADDDDQDSQRRPRRRSASSRSSDEDDEETERRPAATRRSPVRRARR
ncbi:hypothetical protein [Amycolatopsis benzoatilytica]|uniref:hypothetical protein n=1 Tax=Amycolatopsis benzoatilytica TaxID=346045 RepID=UPI00054F1B03|nr:hypothetical protein [Amycolatopsis benzoatilytica]